MESASKGEDSSNLIPCQTETRFLETKRDSLTWGINYSLSLFVYVCFFVSSRKFSIVIVCLLLSSSVVPEKSDLLFIKVKNKTSPTDSCHSSDCDTDLENLDIHHRVAEACPKSKFAGLMVIS